MQILLEMLLDGRIAQSGRAAALQAEDKGSNPYAFTVCAIVSTVECQTSNLIMSVRFRHGAQEYVLGGGHPVLPSPLASLAQWQSACLISA